MNSISANFAASSSLNWSNKSGSEEPLDTLQPGGGLRRRRSGASPGRGEQQDERTFSPRGSRGEVIYPSSPRGSRMPHTANTVALGGENGSPTQSKQAFATSLTPSRNAFPSHLCSYVHSYVHSCTAVGHLPRSAALVQCTVCSVAHTDWFCVSMFHSPCPVQLQSQSLPEA